MPAFAALSTSILDTVARKAATRLFGDSLSGPDLAIFESMDVWDLDPPDVLGGALDLTSIARRSGRWHHQLKAGGQPVGFATTLPQGPEPEDWEVVAVTQSPAATLLDDAVQFVSSDPRIPEDSVVHMLVAPAYHFRGFWIVPRKGDELVVPADISGAPDLQLRHIYPVPEFLQILSQIPVIGGLTPPE